MLAPGEVLQPLLPTRGCGGGPSLLITQGPLGASSSPAPLLQEVCGGRLGTRQGGHVQGASSVPELEVTLGERPSRGWDR